MYAQGWVFHHIGVSVEQAQLSKQARYAPLFKMYTEDAVNQLGLRIQYHAFDEDSSLDERIRTGMHIAFKTENIEQALAGQEIVMPLYQPFAGYRCAMIVVNGVLIELIETNLTEEELWNDDKTLNNGILYGNQD